MYVADMQPNTSLTDTITSTLERAPDWLRRDLCASNPATRRNAEAALATMIAAAIANAEPDGPAGTLPPASTTPPQFAAA